MKLSNSVEAAASLKALQECGLLTGHEIEVVNRRATCDSVRSEGEVLSQMRRSLTAWRLARMVVSGRAFILMHKENQIW